MVYILWAIFAKFLLCVIITEIVQSSSDFSSCDYPVIQTTLFDDPDSKLQELKYVNSTSTESEVEFPYQFLLMNCSAKYPIKWVTDVPRHYYFSYIIDDEHRSQVTSNTTLEVGNGNGDLHVNEVEFTVRLHIGNETLSDIRVTNVTAVCQPVDEERTSCGKTLISIVKQQSAKELLKIRFKRISKDDAHISNRSCRHSNKRDPIQRDNQTQESFQCEPQIIHQSNEWAFHKSSVDSHLSDTNCSDIDSADLLHFNFNKSDLVTPTGLLNCTSKNGQQKKQIPYFLSLPRLCPSEDEDLTLPHLYTNSGNVSLHENEFLSLCIQNGSGADIYVGDNITITCISSIYYFAQGMRSIIVTKQNVSNEKILSYTDISNNGSEHSFGPRGYRNLTMNLIVNSENVHKIACRAPVRESRNWVTKEALINVKVPLKLVFGGGSAEVPVIPDQGSRTHLLCNATGSPPPVLSWSRVNHGKMPEAHHETVHAHRGNHSTSTHPDWITSKLIFSNRNATSPGNLSEYYGRYVCTAQNRFESIEKTFLLENAIEESYATVLNLRNFYKVAWFWVLVITTASVVIALVILLTKIREQSKKLKLFTTSEIKEFVVGNPEMLLSESENYEEINSYAAYLPYDRNQFEIRQENLQFDSSDVLGTGAYGTVYRGIVTRNGESIEVAIKTVHLSNDKMYFLALLSEVKIMCYIGQHEYIVNFIGACTNRINQRQIFVVTEFYENRDLLTYIQTNRAKFEQNFTENGSDSRSNGLLTGYCRFSDENDCLHSLELLLLWALQIADGMAFLSSKKVIHGDLAARNVLLTADLIPKISDFGLSKQLHKYANYVRKGDDLMPWRWLAIECLQYMKFSIKSDIWAYGVVLFELFTLGQVPYPNHAYSDQFVTALYQGKRLCRPARASEKLYDLMLQCWNACPEERPTFMSIQDVLKFDIVDTDWKYMEENLAEEHVQHVEWEDQMQNTLDMETATSFCPEPQEATVIVQAHNVGYVDWNGVT